MVSSVLIMNLVTTPKFLSTCTTCPGEVHASLITTLSTLRYQYYYILQSLQTSTWYFLKDIIFLWKIGHFNSYVGPLWGQ